MKMNNMSLQKKEPYIFISSFIVLFLVFQLFPILYSLLLSTHNWSGMGDMQFVGLGNYINLLTDDALFRDSLFFTFWLLIFGSLTQHVFAIPLAILLNNKLIKGRDAFRTAFFLPYITSSIVIALVFQTFFSTRSGMANFILGLLNIDPVNWLGDSAFLPIAIAIVINWKFIGWNTIIYLAGLQSVPEQLYEQASLDGASKWTQHRFITIPHIIPVIFLAVTISIIGGMKVFDIPYILGGYVQASLGINKASSTAALYIIWLMRRAGKLGKGSAVSWLLFVIIVILTLSYRKILDIIQADRKEFSKIKKNIM
ncbi:MAG: sugar ABC transporter permease [Spirochaetales bacterium]|nr:sugar ABC transporter permease [Spirochaetales bacterium]